MLLVVKKVVESGQLACLGQIFDKINTAYRQHLNTILQSQVGGWVNGVMCELQACMQLRSVFTSQASHSELVALMDDLLSFE